MIIMSAQNFQKENKAILCNKYVDKTRKFYKIQNTQP